MEIRRFILKFMCFSAVLIAVYVFALWQLAQGQIDYFYPKFTYKAGSMIIGSSRSNDAIPPSVLNEQFGDEFEQPILNFSFAQQISDYGPVYLEAIKKKILPATKNGLFIVEVNPGTLSIEKSKVDSIFTLYDDQSFLSKIRRFNMQPNLEYIRKVYSQSLYKGFDRSRRIDKIRYTHDDGWQEVMMKNEFYEVSEDEVQKWKGMKLNEVKHSKQYFKPSTARMYYLEKTIEYLKDHGSVYMVRIPISSGLLAQEHDYWPGFHDDMKKIADKYQIDFLDYAAKGEDYYSYDGSHLFGRSAKAFAKVLSQDIQALQTARKD